MQNKLIVVLILILFGVILYKNYQHEPEVIPAGDKVQKVNELAKVSINSKNKMTKLTDATKYEQLNKHEEEMFNLIMENLKNKEGELRTQEVQELMRKFQNCGQLSQFKYKFETFPQLFSKTQKQVFKNNQDSCNKLLNKHKNLMLVAKSYKGNRVLQKLMGQTQFTAALSFKNRHIPTPEDRNENTRNLIKEFVSTQSNNLLNAIQHNLKLTNFLAEDTSISELLQSKNVNYLKSVTLQALTLFSCHSTTNNNCNEDSFTMQKECFENDEACGLTLKQWYNYAFTDAHLDDIDLIKNYYFSLH